MTYLILAQICLTVGTPNWVVAVSYIGFGIHCIKAIIIAIKKSLEERE